MAMDDQIPSSRPPARVAICGRTSRVRIVGTAAGAADRCVERFGRGRRDQEGADSGAPNRVERCPGRPVAAMPCPRRSARHGRPAKAEVGGERHCRSYVREVLA